MLSRKSHQTSTSCHSPSQDSMTFSARGAPFQMMLDFYSFEYALTILMDSAYTTPQTTRLRLVNTCTGNRDSVILIGRPAARIGHSSHTILLETSTDCLRIRRHSLQYIAMLK